MHGDGDQEDPDIRHRLCPTYASDINSPLRHVRTRIYFTRCLCVWGSMGGVGKYESTYVHKRLYFTSYFHPTPSQAIQHHPRLPLHTLWA